MKIKNIALIMFIAVFMCGCSGWNDTEYTKDYEYAVIRTSAKKYRKTQVIFLDSDMNYVGEKTYDYGEVGGCGFNPTFENDKKVYDISLAYGYDKDPSKILEMDTEDGSCVSYDFDRVNITDLVVTDSYVYAVSNLNMITYIDRCPINGTKDDIETIEIKDVTCCWLYNVGDKVYAADLDTMGNFYLCDFDKGEAPLYEELSSQLAYEPLWSVEYGNDLIMAGAHKLYFFSTDTGVLRDVRMPEGTNEIKSLCLDGDILYVSRAEFHEENTDTVIYKYDLKTEKVIDTYEIPTALMQFEVRGNTIIIITDEQVLKYTLEEGGKATKVGEYTVETKSYQYVSAGFFNPQIEK